MDGLHSNKRKRPGTTHDNGDGDEAKISLNVTEHFPPAKRGLRIVTDMTTSTGHGLRQQETGGPEDTAARAPASLNSDTDSLFDEVPSTSSLSCAQSPVTIGTAEAFVSSRPAADSETIVPAQRTAPSIPGLHLYPASCLPDELADEVMWTCIRTYFQHSTANQVMLFERAPILPAVSSSSLPPVLTDLLGTLADLLRPLLPSHTHALLFPPPDASTRARQAILNLYWPGEGITPHVDLLDRFGDGIVGVSLGSGCVMRFDRVAGDGMHGAEERGRWDVYLPQGSVLVMSEEARYGWTHGIEKRMEDLVEDSGESERAAESCSWVERDVRLSITFRWLLPGADIVGGHPAEGHA